MGGDLTACEEFAQLASMPVQRLPQVSSACMATGCADIILAKTQPVSHTRVMASRRLCCGLKVSVPGPAGMMVCLKLVSAWQLPATAWNNCLSRVTSTFTLLVPCRCASTARPLNPCTCYRRETWGQPWLCKTLSAPMMLSPYVSQCTNPLVGQAM